MTHERKGYKEQLIVGQFLQLRKPRVVLPVETVLECVVGYF